MACAYHLTTGCLHIAKCFTSEGGAVCPYIKTVCEICQDAFACLNNEVKCELVNEFIGTSK